MDSTLFTRKIGKDLFICQIYIDDIIFSSTNTSFCEEFSKIMTDRFEMPMMEEIKYFLCFQIKQLEDGTFISQIKYTLDLLKKFGIDKAKPIKTSMDTNYHLDLDMDDKSIDQKVYRFIIDSLFYLCTSRPDIMVSVCMCARFQTAPTDCHLRAVKRIMRYLILTPYLVIWYPKGAHFKLIGYSNADYAGCKVDRKITSRTYQFLDRSLVYWSYLK
jgi:hypothetical protein